MEWLCWALTQVSCITFQRCCKQLLRRLRTVASDTLNDYRYSKTSMKPGVKASLKTWILSLHCLEVCWSAESQTSFSGHVRNNIYIAWYLETLPSFITEQSSYLCHTFTRTHAHRYQDTPRFRNKGTWYSIIHQLVLYQHTVRQSDLRQVMQRLQTIQDICFPVTDLSSLLASWTQLSAFGT